jgi:hypothetical protein
VLVVFDPPARPQRRTRRPTSRRRLGTRSDRFRNLPRTPRTPSTTKPAARRRPVGDRAGTQQGPPIWSRRLPFQKRNGAATPRPSATRTTVSVSSSVQFLELQAEGEGALRRGEVTEAELEERPALGGCGGGRRGPFCWGEDADRVPADPGG